MSVRAITTLLLIIPSLAIAQSARPRAAVIARAVDSLAQEVMRAGLAPALGVAVVMDGRTILERSYGSADVTRGIPADGRTLWYTASTSKAFAGFATALLAEEGRLAFETPIARLLPRARWHPSARPDSLTLAHFLSHTAGLDGDALVLSAAFTGEVPESRWHELLAHAAPTGSRDLIYTNFGYNVAGMVIDELHPAGWRDFLATRVFGPAGMRDTHGRMTGIPDGRIAMPHAMRADGRFETAPFQKTDETLNAAGGHLMTLADLARFTTLQMDSGRLGRRQVYPAAAVARAHRMLAAQTRDASRRFAYFVRDGWGAGWDIGSYDGEPMVSRFGSYASTRSHLSFLPRRRIGVVAMTTGRPGWIATDLLAAFAYDLEAGRPDARARAAQRLRDLTTQLLTARTQVASADSVRRAREAVPLSHPLRDFAGRYAHPQAGVVSFRVEGEALHFSWGAISSVAQVLDAPSGTMRVERAMSGMVAAFRFPSSGPATAVELDGYTFTRMDR